MNFISKKRILPALFICAVIPTTLQAASPYPQSSVIKEVLWNLSSPKTVIAPDFAVGSDLWTTTWADDDNLYTGFGDGGGFGGTNINGRVTIGVGVIKGTPENINASNVWGGVNTVTKANFEGKPSNLIAVNGKLYMGVTEQGTWARMKMCESSDYAVTWTCTGWVWDEPGGLWASLTFLQFGKNNELANDNYTYIYTHKDGTSSPRYDILLGRVPNDKIMDRNAYEFYTGLDNSEVPIWSTKATDSAAIFTNPASVGFGRAVMYHPVLNRYILTDYHNEKGGWGMYDAPNPWGPWTTAFYTDRWMDVYFKFEFTIPQKWINGNDFVMIFSGVDKYDDWNTVAGTFVLNNPDTVLNPPTTPKNIKSTISR